jgi:hypothetical protein
MTHKPIALDLDPEEKRVIVAIGGGVDNAQAVAAGLALHPELLASAAPKSDESGFEGLPVAGLIQKADHEDLPGFRVLHNAGDKAVHLRKVNLGFAHLSSVLFNIIITFCLNAKSPPVLAPAGF